MSAASRFNNALRHRAEHHPAQTAITPNYILDPVRAMLGGTIYLDPCTTPDNPVEALHFYTPPTDGAAQPWDADTIWVNPPYGHARDRWISRCIEAATAGRQVVLLIPAATDTRPFQRALAHATTALLIRGRVKFGQPRANGRQIAASHPSALIAWNADLSQCARLGLVIKPMAPQGHLLPGVSR
ncbi:DNA N-6-adenine-methyltransferase [Micromonospora echinospora]